MSSSVRHTGIVVSDINCWLKFLTGYFDFEIWVDQVEKGGFISRLLGLPNTEVRTIKLRDSKGGVIEILYFHSPRNHEHSTSSLNPNSFGITHIALEVRSLDRKIDTLSADGYSSIAPVELSEDGRARVCYLRGPENVLFELVEIVA